MNCSFLKYHLYLKNLEPGPLCSCGEVESTSRYLLYCPNYLLQRQCLVTKVGIPLSLNLLLFGDISLPYETNKSIFLSVQEYINKSPKGHWSLTWVQWALLLKVRFLSKSESMTAIFVKSVRTATIAIFQFRIRGCIRFVAVAFRSEEEVLWRRNPSLPYFWQIAPPPWIRPWVEFAEKPINRCVIIGTSSLSSFVNIHQVVL